MDILKVYSHPRSGTNFLGALIKKNFYPDINLDVSGKWGHWANRTEFKEPVPHGQIFGSHNYSPHFPGHTKRSIYIYRDGRAVALSVWKSKNFNNKYVESLPFSDYLRCNIDWKGTPGAAAQPTQNIIQHWLGHVENWQNSNSMIIRYEDLLLNTEEVLTKIANKFNLEFKKGYQPLNKMVGPSPNTGNTNEWEKHFTDEDLDYFHTFVPKTNKFLYNV